MVDRPDRSVRTPPEAKCAVGETGIRSVTGSTPAARQEATIVGKRRSRKSLAQVAGVEGDVVGALGPHHAVDRLGHDVARGQLGELVLADHEPRARRRRAGRRPRRASPPRPAAAAPPVRPERARAVGWNWTNSRSVTSAPARRASAAPSPVDTDRVGGRREDLAHPAGGHHDRTGQDGPDAVVGALAEHVQCHSGGPAGRVAEQVEHECVLDQPDPRVAVHGRMQRPLHLGPGRVAAGVHDPVGVVAALAGQHQRAVRVAVELGAPAHQFAHPGRALADQHVDRGRVAQPDSGHERVLGVRLGRVQRVEHRRDATLRPARRAVVDVDLGDDRDVQAGLAQVQGGGQSGDPGTDDDHVGRLGPARLGSARAGGAAAATSSPQSTSQRAAPPRDAQHAT